MATLLAGLAVSLLAVVRPDHVDVERADAVMVHAYKPWRLQAARELGDTGVAPVLVVSYAGGQAYGRTAAAMAQWCRRQPGYEIVCVAPAPVSTIGEARAFGRLIEERGWRRVVLVTDRQHLARARAVVSQCTDAEVLAVPVEPSERPGPATVAAEWVRLAASVTLVRAC